MKNILLLSLCFGCLFCSAQSGIQLQNNTYENFFVTALQNGSAQLASADWLVPNDTVRSWELKREVLRFRRDTLALAGDTVAFEVQVALGAEVIRLQVQVIDSQLYYSAAGPGFDDPWYVAAAFRERTFQLGGEDVILKYKPLANGPNPDGDILFALHRPYIYDIDAADFSNAAVMNCVSYNIKFLPLIEINYEQRIYAAASLFSPYQDVVVLQEAFDLNAIPDYVIPAMEAAGFYHNSGILNSPDLPEITVPGNGGVIIFSRWPIELTDQIQFSQCVPGSADCLSAKGVKYARVNKLGTKYHIFGTHMQAGGAGANSFIKYAQQGEMADLIAALNIPANEAVLMAGDYNARPYDDRGGFFSSLIDSLKPILPTQTGFYNSTFSGALGKIIDYVFPHSDYLIP